MKSSLSHLEMSECATQSDKTMLCPLKLIFPCSSICWDQRDFEKLQSRQSVSISSEPLQRTRCARSPDQSSIHPTPTPKDPRAQKPSVQGPVLLWCPLFKLHDLLTKSPVWKPRRYIQLPLPKPMQPLRITYGASARLHGPFQPLLSNTPRAHEHHQEENSTAGQDESQFCWFVLGFLSASML